MLTTKVIYELVTSSFFVTTSKAPVTTRDALVTGEESADAERRKELIGLNRLRSLGYLQPEDSQERAAMGTTVMQFNRLVCAECCTVFQVLAEILDECQRQVAMEAMWHSCRVVQMSLKPCPGKVMGSTHRLIDTFL